MSFKEIFEKNKKHLIFSALATFGILVVVSLLLNIHSRKTEGQQVYKRLIEVNEDTTDPAKWGVSFPLQYESYLKTAESTATKYGGHGGSEALPEQKIERDPWLKRIFLGYAFSIDYRDRRGHAYMLEDQENTERLTKPQTGSCLHCHASVMPLYRSLGDGDATRGFEESYKYSYQELNKKLHDQGHAHPVSCVDCHEPDSMKIRVTRPGFIQGIQKLAKSDADVPYAPSIKKYREDGKKGDYDPNKDASRQEMRSFVCAQCHVEYYCASEMSLSFPWGEGLKAEEVEKYWNQTKFKNGKRFYDYKHKETGAEILKAQHPEYELYTQGVHARSNVSCADCHMPYSRVGATKVSDHWVRSPLLNVENACQSCHNIAKDEILTRVEIIQDRNYALLQRAGEAVVGLIDAVVAAKKRGISEAKLKPALELQRKAQWRLDFIAAENSMGFHAPQEAARILAEAIDYARQGELAASNAR